MCLEINFTNLRGVLGCGALVQCICCRREIKSLLVTQSLHLFDIPIEILDKVVITITSTQYLVCKLVKSQRFLVFIEG